MIEPEDLSFDARSHRKVDAYVVARDSARDGYMRFVFELDRLWYVSRIEPPYRLVKRVEAVIPDGYRYHRVCDLDA